MEKKQNLHMINNDFYDELNELWIESTDHPVALLRAENAFRNPWIQEVLSKAFPYPCRVLDVGCGGGYLTNFLAQKGHLVTGIDLSVQSLHIAKQQDLTKSVEYVHGNAYSLPFSDGVFDVVCAMDVLEHVEDPHQSILEAARVLKKGGLFFFHTFNRNFLSYFIVIKGVEWCLSKTPRNLHVYPLFIKPKELDQLCKSHRLQIKEVKGVRPDFLVPSFWKMLLTRRVDKNFKFVFTSSLATGYCGYALRV